ncbi:uncharacterized protein BO87DRAFT_229925 [Aspergillus neoniger CBS 115656]|uniref:Uncharacterized protein n=1 Tax=Aspergillus neoniger (strain CBS 115656) TaxID=1448310 RepID=A0A318YQY5_ASPNB|nr:hypothetical protein BO87DRAFT_229925 [Aspergillus neoniger CBS 115656]PYH36736.1 hypothetical protein BO87DRAFT_229925 [Aspergillus neoniger CBS 115656]
MNFSLQGFQFHLLPPQSEFLIEFFYPFLLFSLPLVAYLCFSLSFFTVLASPTPDSTIFFFSISLGCHQRFLAPVSHIIPLLIVDLSARR